MDKLQNPFLSAIATETPLRVALPINAWREQVASTDRATPKTLVLRQMRAET